MPFFSAALAAATSQGAHPAPNSITTRRFCASITERSVATHSGNSWTAGALGVGGGRTVSENTMYSGGKKLQRVVVPRKSRKLPGAAGSVANGANRLIAAYEVRSMYPGSDRRRNSLLKTI